MGGNGSDAVDSYAVAVRASAKPIVAVCAAAFSRACVGIGARRGQRYLVSDNQDDDAGFCHSWWAATCLMRVGYRK